MKNRTYTLAAALAAALSGQHAAASGYHFGNRRGFGCGIAAENAFEPCFEGIPP